MHIHICMLTQEEMTHESKRKVMRGLIGVVVVLLSLRIIGEAKGEIPKTKLRKIDIINKEGPHLGIVAPNNFELNPLLNSSAFLPNPSLPYIDFAGRRFRYGKISNESVVIVMTGLGMLNAGVGTQLLVSLFRIKGVVHYGIAGNANVNLQIGDVTIPQYWAHSGLWNWQRYGDGPEDLLSLEAAGDYTREFGYIEFSDYNTKNGSQGNLLNRVWYQPEEIFPISGTPEVRQHIFWVPVDHTYLNLSHKLEFLAGLSKRGCRGIHWGFKCT